MAANTGYTFAKARKSRNIGQQAEIRVACHAEDCRKGAKMGFSSVGIAAAFGAVLLVSACEEGAKPLGFLNKSADNAEAGATSGGAEVARQVSTDVEAPDIFQKTEEGLWDGRPSLGGVWVAHPDVKDPERVIIRNSANGKFVIGALFRRERENPGPSLQVSSDAAAALDMVAGAPQELNVTALRREEAPTPEVNDEALVADAAADTTADTNVAAEAIAPDASGASAGEADPLAAAEAAIAEVEAGTAGSAATPPVSGKRQAKLPADASLAPGAVAVIPEPGAAASEPAPAPTTATTTSSLSKPFIQIGIFSVEANATKAASALSKAGVPTQVRTEASQGKSFWRVVAGPASNEASRKTLLGKVKSEGYGDAYFVSN